MSESDIQKRVRLALGREPDCVVWRNNVGVAQFFSEQVQRVEYGLCEGSADLIGITSLVVTPEMVGKKLGRFTALELKRVGARTEKGRAEKQRLFRELVLKLGGHAEVVYGELEAIEALKKARTV
jgi:hypothetical protein